MDPKPKTDVNLSSRTLRTARRAIIATALIPVLALAQDPGPKPRLELADSARRTPQRAAPASSELRTGVRVPSSAAATGAAPAAVAPAPRATGEVRRDFVRNQAALGVVLYGPAFATTVARDGLAWAASYVLVAGGSFVAAAEVSRFMTVTDPMQRLATGAPIRGAIAGSILAALIDADVPSTAGTIFFGSLGATAVGLWRGQGMDDGEAAATLFGSDVLGLAGYGLATAVGLENGTEANRTRLWMSLGGMVAGAPLGQAYAALVPYNVSAGDLTAMSAAGGVGMLAGLSVIANGDRSEREIAAALTIGGLAGLAAGDLLLVRRYDHTPDNGRMMIAGGVAGGLMGAGVALLTGGAQPRWSAYSAALTTVGAAAGVAWAQYYVRPKADGGLRVAGLSLNPVGVVAAATQMRGSYTLGSIRF